jgi:mannose-6-phosphate isomerase
MAERFGKPLPPGKKIGEAWLIADHPQHESVVAEGALAGLSLRQLMQRWPGDLLGNAKPTKFGRFPLLLKLLDAAENLSVQVHPDDAIAEQLGEPDIGKTEAWHILDADDGAVLYCGFDTPMDRAQFRSRAESGEIVRDLHALHPKPGDDVFVPAGTVHAIGAGVLLAEIQQNSDLTYRIYDWGRTDAEGKPRALHLEKAVRAMDLDSPLNLSHSVTTCTYFSVRRIEINGGAETSNPGSVFHILLGCKGALAVGDTQLRPGEALLIPGVCDRYKIDGCGVILDYSIDDGPDCT